MQDVVGTLGFVFKIDFGFGEVYRIFGPFCTASLIGESAAVTAKHCTNVLRFSRGGQVAFAVGPDGTNPDEFVYVAGVEEARGPNLGG